MSFKPMMAAAALWAAAASAFAQVHVDDVWMRATVPQQHATAAFMRITSDRPVRLVAASSPAAPTAEVHEMSMQGNVMTMRPVQGIDVLPGKVTVLTPSGYHVMLLDLRRQIKVGDRVPLTLVFEDRDRKRITVEASAEARALNAAAGQPMKSMASAPH